MCYMLYMPYILCFFTGQHLVHKKYSGLSEIIQELFIQINNSL